MENNEKNQADKKPCVLDGSKRPIYSMLNFAMPSTSHGYHQQQNSPFMITRPPSLYSLSFPGMENIEKKQADKKPCVPDDSKPEINSMQNVALPSTSHGYDDQEQEYARVFNEIFTKLHRCDANENEIPELFKCFQEKLPGYRFGFDAKDDKLITEYLMKKVAHEPVHRCFIRDANVYDQHPKELAALYPRHDSLVDEWYFFSSRERKYPNGTRPKRAAGIGFWKATGANRPVEVNDETVGFKQALVFYEGNHPKGVKTNWIMYEYKGMEKRKRSSKDDMRLDDYVLCRIYCKKNKSLKGEEEEEEEEEKEDEEEKDEKKDEEEKVEEGSSSKIAKAGANRDEEYKVPPYDADDIILTPSVCNTFFGDNQEQWQL